MSILLGKMTAGYMRSMFFILSMSVVALQAGMGPPDIQWRFGDWGDIEISLRLKKEGNTYTAWYKASEDKDWIDIGKGEFKLTPPLWIGIFAGNAGGKGKMQVVFEYFQDHLKP